jgi:hypothetical protein
MEHLRLLADRKDSNSATSELGLVFDPPTASRPLVQHGRGKIVGVSSLWSKIRSAYPDMKA